MKTFTPRDGWTLQAYRYALDPSPTQIRALHSHAGAARLAYNWGLAAVKAVLDQRAAERSYGIESDALTPALGWNLPALRKAWNAAKDQVAPWWTQNSKEAYNTGLDALARALGNWNASRTGTRNGLHAGFPRFKSRRRSTPAVRFTTGPIRAEEDRRHVTLPPARHYPHLREHLQTAAAGGGRDRPDSVRHGPWEAGRWYVSFQCEVQRAARVPARPGMRSSAWTWASFSAACP